MGRVVVQIKVENLADLALVSRGYLTLDQVRSLEIADALVDTGATTLALPSRHIQTLGLKPLRDRISATATGKRTVKVYEAVRLTIMDRDCTVDVIEVPDDVPALVGQVPLELLDWVVDPRNQRLVGNPAHNGEHVIELYLNSDS